jgi:hypothetical protein
MKLDQSGGSQSASPGTAVQLAATHIPGPAGQATPPAPVGVDSAATQKGAVLTVEAPAAPSAATKGGGAASGGASGGSAASATPVKVVLAAAKKKKPGVVLAAAGGAKPVVPALSTSGGGLKKAGAGHTRHKARKIKVSMKTLRKKIHRAKTIRKSAEGASLEQIKKELQKAGILKADSKAPEGILRQMYADFMTLKSRAL